MKIKINSGSWHYLRNISILNENDDIILEQDLKEDDCKELAEKFIDHAFEIHDGAVNKYISEDYVSKHNHELIIHYIFEFLKPEYSIDLQIKIQDLIEEHVKDPRSIKDDMKNKLNLLLLES